MFEDALMESGGKIRSKTKYWSLLTLVLNGLVLAALVIWPLLRPAALPKQFTAALMVAPPPPPPSPPRPAQKVVPIKSEMLKNQLQIPNKIQNVKIVNESAPTPSMVGVPEMEGMGSPNGPLGIVRNSGTMPVVKQAPAKRLNISSGAMQGNLLQQTLPQYPPMAKAAHVQGTVVLQATISKTGTIENLRVESGPALLQEAALEAVRTWRYRPYLLNGNPVEVETTINVVFSLGD